MATYKKFFIYFLLIFAFFIFSQILIYFLINTTYQYKSVDIRATLPINIEIQATSVNGIAKGKVVNNTENIIENQYIKMDCYSKHNVLMGTKYVEIDKLEANEEKEFEVRFNFNKVDRAVVDTVTKQAVEDKGTEEVQMQSDPQLGFAALITALLLLHFI